MDTIKLKQFVCTTYLYVAIIFDFKIGFVHMYMYNECVKILQYVSTYKDCRIYLHLIYM